MININLLNSVFKDLDHASARLEYAINSTPTGEVRVKLTEVNICVLQSISFLREAADLWSKYEQD